MEGPNSAPNHKVFVIFLASGYGLGSLPQGTARSQKHLIQVLFEDCSAAQAEGRTSVAQARAPMQTAREVRLLLQILRQNCGAFCYADNVCGSAGPCTEPDSYTCTGGEKFCVMDSELGVGAK